MRILFVTAEYSPLARTGGLGDAVAGLAEALARSGLEVQVALPRYRALLDVGVPAGDGVWAAERNGVEVRLVDDAESFDRPGGLYGPAPGEEFTDSWRRWGRFAVAAARLAVGSDVVHLHDPHAGATALLSPVPSVFTVHNPAHPVLGPLEESLALLGLGPAFGAPSGPLEWFGKANYLKAGLVGATRVTTVSPGFARELAGGPEESFGLGDVVRSLPAPLVGILNGIDAAAWQPDVDPLLPAPFAAGDLSGRAASRDALLERTGLDDGTLFGMVGRMSGQKGIPLIDPPLADLVADGLRFVAVGNGDLDDTVDAWVARHPRAVAHLPFDDEAARLTFAGSDAYLMPSRFEPSGLGQLYAMRYGAPPVVRLTGGLADSVVDIDEDPTGGTGIGFRPYLPAELAKSVRRAIRYHGTFPEEWRQMQIRGMTHDWSWDRRAAEYVEVYESALG